MKKLALAFLICGFAALAAENGKVDITEFRQPGDVIRLEVKLSGADAAQVRSGSLLLYSLTETSSNQAGFDVNAQGSLEIHDGIGVGEIKITDKLATGDYGIQVSVDGPVGRIVYSSPRDFKLDVIHIRNSRRFERPEISVRELPTR